MICTYVDQDEKFADLVIDVTEMKGNYHYWSCSGRAFVLHVLICNLNK